MKVSVALCTYNGEKFLHEQLQSIFSQSRPVDEIIICDDGSKDSTIEILNHYAEKYPNIIYIHPNECNLGVIKNFEKAVKLCTGSLIFFCDQDDVWKINKVERTIDFFEKNPECLGMFSDAELIDGSSVPVPGISLWDLLLFKQFAKDGLDILKYIVLYSNVVTGACLTVTKEAVPFILPFEKITYLLHDELIALKLAKLKRIKFVSENLIQYRLHNQQYSNSLLKMKLVEKNNIRKNVIAGNASANPLEYYRYWKRRIDIVKEIINEGLNINQYVLDALYMERKKGLLAYLNTRSFIRKKRNLVKLWLKSEEAISLTDVIFS